MKDLLYLLITVGSFVVMALLVGLLDRRLEDPSGGER